ncbi:RraA family protein [Nocardia vaccinii]|uniref:RraA family protein n=1 Tax=Nocardia vaccinii TaxID=1822 RepID=UPI000834F9D6|nr:hypothetical protein [Nocardia vaccinii]
MTEQRHSTSDDTTAFRVVNLVFPTATLHEAAGRIGALTHEIKPVDSDFRIWGPAYTVRTGPGHNLWIHRGVYEAPAGSVLVVEITPGDVFGYWGEILSVAAQARGLAGLVIDGGVRDTALLSEVGFPVFAAAVSISGTGKDPQVPGALGEPVSIRGVTVRSGDLVVGDRDGVVVLAADTVDDVLAASRAREEKEADMMRALRNGATTLDLLGLR